MNVNGILIGSEDPEGLVAYQPGEAPEGWIATFSDPDDNYFQLLSPME